MSMINWKPFAVWCSVNCGSSDTWNNNLILTTLVRKVEIGGVMPIASFW